MRGSLFVSIASIALLCWLATSCASSRRSDCTRVESVPLTRSDIPVVIEATDSLQVFDMGISFMGKHLNGMMLVKKQNHETARIVVNSYFGMSMADFEIRPDTFVVHYLLDAMNRQAIVNLFKKDFGLLLGLHLPERFIAQKSLCAPPEELISVEISQGKCQYWIDGENGNITKIKVSGISVEIPSHNSPRTITLKHRGIFSPTIVIKEVH